MDAKLWGQEDEQVQPKKSSFSDIFDNIGAWGRAAYADTMAIPMGRQIKDVYDKIENGQYSSREEYDSLVADLDRLQNERNEYRDAFNENQKILNQNDSYLKDFTEIGGTVQGIGRQARDTLIGAGLGAIGGSVVPVAGTASGAMTGARIGNFIGSIDQAAQDADTNAIDAWEKVLQEGGTSEQAEQAYKDAFWNNMPTEALDILSSLYMGGKLLGSTGKILNRALGGKLAGTLANGVNKAARFDLPAKLGTYVANKSGQAWLGQGVGVGLGMLGNAAEEGIQEPWQDYATERAVDIQRRQYDPTHEGIRDFSVFGDGGLLDYYTTPEGMNTAIKAAKMGAAFGGVGGLMSKSQFTELGTAHSDSIQSAKREADWIEKQGLLKDEGNLERYNNVKETMANVYDLSEDEKADLSVEDVARMYHEYYTNLFGQGGNRQEQNAVSQADFLNEITGEETARRGLMGDTATKYIDEFGIRPDNETLVGINDNQQVLSEEQVQETLNQEEEETTGEETENKEGIKAKASKPDFFDNKTSEQAKEEKASTKTQSVTKKKGIPDKFGNWRKIEEDDGFDNDLNNIGAEAKYENTKTGRIAHIKRTKAGYQVTDITDPKDQGTTRNKNGKKKLLNFLKSSWANQKTKFMSDGTQEQEQVSQALPQEDGVIATKDITKDENGDQWFNGKKIQSNKAQTIHSMQDLHDYYKTHKDLMSKDLYAEISRQMMRFGIGNANNTEIVLDLTNREAGGFGSETTIRTDPNDENSAVAKAIVRLYAGADLATAAHEMAHLGWMNLSDQDRATFTKWAEKTQGEFVAKILGMDYDQNFRSYLIEALTNRESKTSQDLWAKIKREGAVQQTLGILNGQNYGLAVEERFAWEFSNWYAQGYIKGAKPRNIIERILNKACATLQGALNLLSDTNRYLNGENGYNGGDINNIFTNMSTRGIGQQRQTVAPQVELRTEMTQPIQESPYNLRQGVDETFEEGLYNNPQQNLGRNTGTIGAQTYETPQVEERPEQDLSRNTGNVPKMARTEGVTRKPTKYTPPPTVDQRVEQMNRGLKDEYLDIDNPQTSPVNNQTLQPSQEDLYNQSLIEGLKSDQKAEVERVKQVRKQQEQERKATEKAEKERQKQIEKEKKEKQKKKDDLKKNAESKIKSANSELNKKNPNLDDINNQITEVEKAIKEFSDEEYTQRMEQGINTPMSSEDKGTINRLQDGLKKLRDKFNDIKEETSNKSVGQEENSSTPKQQSLFGKEFEETKSEPKTQVEETTEETKKTNTVEEPSLFDNQTEQVSEETATETQETTEQTQEEQTETKEEPKEQVQEEDEIAKRDREEKEYYSKKEFDYNGQKYKYEPYWMEYSRLENGKEIKIERNSVEYFVVDSMRKMDSPFYKNKPKLQDVLDDLESDVYGANNRLKGTTKTELKKDKELQRLQKEKRELQNNKKNLQKTIDGLKDSTDTSSLEKAMSGIDYDIKATDGEIYKYLDEIEEMRKDAKEVKQNAPKAIKILKAMYGNKTTNKSQTETPIQNKTTKQKTKTKKDLRYTTDNILRGLLNDTNNTEEYLAHTIQGHDSKWTNGYLKTLENDFNKTVDSLEKAGEISKEESPKIKEIYKETIAKVTSKVPQTSTVEQPVTTKSEPVETETKAMDEDKFKNFVYGIFTALDKNPEALKSTSVQKIVDGLQSNGETLTKEQIETIEKEFTMRQNRVEEEAKAFEKEKEDAKNIVRKTMLDKYREFLKDIKGDLKAFHKKWHVMPSEESAKKYSEDNIKTFMWFCNEIYSGNTMEGWAKQGIDKNTLFRLKNDKFISQINSNTNSKNKNFFYVSQQNAKQMYKDFISPEMAKETPTEQVQQTSTETGKPKKRTFTGIRNKAIKDFSKNYIGREEALKNPDLSFARAYYDIVTTLEEGEGDYEELPLNQDGELSPSKAKAYFNKALTVLKYGADNGNPECNYWLAELASGEESPNIDMFDTVEEAIEERFEFSEDDIAQMYKIASDGGIKVAKSKLPDIDTQTEVVEETETQTSPQTETATEEKPSKKEESKTTPQTETTTETKQTTIDKSDKNYQRAVELVIKNRGMSTTGLRFALENEGIKLGRDKVEQYLVQMENDGIVEHGDEGSLRLLKKKPSTKMQEAGQNAENQTLLTPQVEEELENLFWKLIRKKQFHGMDSRWESGKLDYYRSLSNRRQGKEFNPEFIKGDKAFLNAIKNVNDYIHEKFPQYKNVYRGVDGHWRFEFSDKDANFINGFEKLGGKTLDTTLEKILKHDNLYKFYSKLKEMPVHLVRNTKMQEIMEDTEHKYYAMYDPDEKSIYINSDMFESNGEVRNSLLHEIQHAIQDIEGFANGTNDNTYNNDYDFSEGEKQAVLTEQRSNMSDEELQQNPRSKTLNPNEKTIIQEQRPVKKVAKTPSTKMQSNGQNNLGYIDKQKDIYSVTFTKSAQQNAENKKKMDFYRKNKSYWRENKDAQTGSITFTRALPYQQHQKTIIYDEINGKKVGKRKKAKWREYYEAFKDHVIKWLFNDKHFLEKAARNVGAIESYMRMMVMKDQGAVAGAAIEDGIVKHNGKNGERTKSLNSIIEAVGEENQTDFLNYCEAFRVLDLKKRNIEQKMKPQDAIDEINKVKNSKNAKLFEEQRKNFIEYNHELLWVLVDGGFITEQQYDKFIENDPNFIPLAKNMDELEGYVDGFKDSKTMINVAHPMHKIGTSMREVANPFLEMQKRTVEYYVKASRNKAGHIFVHDIAEAIAQNAKGDVVAQNQGMVRKLASRDRNGKKISHDNKQYVFYVWENGEKQYYQVADREIYVALKSFDAEQMGALSKIMNATAGKASRLVRNTATMTPDFGLRNLVRDNMEAFISSEHGFLPLVDSLWGMYQMANDTQWFKEYQRMNGEHLSLNRDGEDVATVEHDIKDNVKFYKTYVPLFKKDLHEFMDKDRSKLARAKSLLKLVSVDVLPLQSLYKANKRLNDYLETGTRIGEYRNARMGYKGLKGRLFETSGSTIWTTDMDLSRAKNTEMIAAYKSKDITLNFGQHGVLGKELNRYIPFFNASLQGIYKLGNTLDDMIHADDSRRRQELMFKCALMGAMGMAAALAGQGDDDYDEAPDYEHENFWILPNGIRIPKDQLFGKLIGGTVEKATAQYLKDGDVKKLELVQDILGNFAIDKCVPALVDLGWGTIGNYDSFKKKSVTPEYMADKLGYLQKDLSTSKAGADISETVYKVTDGLFKALGYNSGGVDIGAKKVDFVISKTLSNLGKYATSLWELTGGNEKMTRGAEVEDKGGFAETSKELPYPLNQIVGTFATNRNSFQSISDFYERHRELKKLSSDESIMSKNEKKAWEAYQAAYKKDKQYRDALKAIKLDKSLTGAQKRQKADKIFKQQISMARKLHDWEKKHGLV